MKERENLKIKVLSLKSEYFESRSFRIQISTSGQQKISIDSDKLLDKERSTKLVFEKTSFLEIRVLQIEEKAQKEGYFMLPLQKLFNFPEKQHLINIKLVLKNKSDNKIYQDQAGALKMSIIYQKSD